jgi:hypothetical protein
VTINFYADVNYPGPVVKGLKRRGVDVLRAQDDGRSELADEEVLARATELGRVLLTQDNDFFQIARRWQSESRDFLGVLFSHHRHLTYRQLIDELEVVGVAGMAGDFTNRIDVLPLS